MNIKFAMQDEQPKLFLLIDLFQIEASQMRTWRRKLNPKFWRNVIMNVQN